MGFFDDMGYCTDFEYPPPSSVHGEDGPVREEHDGNEDDYSDEDVDVDELERRMWRDKMLLKKLKEQSKEQARRKMSRARARAVNDMSRLVEPSESARSKLGSCSVKTSSSSSVAWLNTSRARAQQGSARKLVWARL